MVVEPPDKSRTARRGSAGKAMQSKSRRAGVRRVRRLRTTPKLKVNLFVYDYVYVYEKGKREILA